jgi:hypothetical protein
LMYVISKINQELYVLININKLLTLTKD